MEKVAVAPLFLFPWSLLPEKLHLLLLEPFLKKKKEKRRRRRRGRKRRGIKSETQVDYHLRTV